jgi:hypothetical protein
MKKKIVAALVYVLPLVVMAQTPVPDAVPEQEGGARSLLGWLKIVLSRYIIPIIISLALVLFLFGLLSYITAGADEEKRGTARNYMIYGIIALFVMVSVWGLVAILNRTFGIGQGGTPKSLPTAEPTP